MSAPPFGVPELLAAVGGARRVLDLGCGSGRLTVELARAGAEVSGLDTAERALADARDRAEAEGVRLRLLHADVEQELPFAGASFDAVVSRLVLMIPREPVQTLREVERVLVEGGVVATALWAGLERNPWFAGPREAVRSVLGAEAGAFAGAFGRLGDPEAAAFVHREAGFADVDAGLLHETVERADAAAHWQALAAENGHFRRVDASLDDERRSLVIADLERRLAPFMKRGVLRLPRELVLVTARRSGAGDAP